MVRTSKKVKLEKTDASSNENSKPSTNELHVDENLDGSAEPVTIALGNPLHVAAGRKFSLQKWCAGRRFFLDVPNPFEVHLDSPW
ncbi:hypothetical protein ES708_28780 [subsurface metagenome]